MIVNPKQEVGLQIDLSSKAFSGRIIYFRNTYEGYTEKGDALDMAIIGTIKRKFPKTTAKMNLMLFYDSIDQLRSRVHEYPFQHLLKIGVRNVTLFYYCNKKDLIFVKKSLDGLEQVTTSGIAESLIESLSDITSYTRN